jgi:hypothetical protein
MLDAILPLARARILHAEWPPWEQFLVMRVNTTIVTDDIEMSEVADL